MQSNGAIPRPAVATVVKSLIVNKARHCQVNFSSARVSVQFLTEMKWTAEDVDKLIGLYRDNPCLWNFSSPDYEDRVIRESAIYSQAEK